LSEVGFCLRAKYAHGFRARKLTRMVQDI
jgi:hypothetical protein